MRVVTGCHNEDKKIFRTPNVDKAGRLAQKDAPINRETGTSERIDLPVLGWIFSTCTGT